MRRRLHNLATVTSLIAALLLTAAWVTSYWRAVSLSRATRIPPTPERSTVLTDDRLSVMGGGIMIISSRVEYILPKAEQDEYWPSPGWKFVAFSGESNVQYPYFRDTHPIWTLGIDFVRRDDARKPWTSRVFSVRALTVPCALPWVVLMILPGLWVYWRVRDPRFRKGHCRACGYDLRGSAGACPECGATNAQTNAVTRA